MNNVEHTGYGYSGAIEERIKFEVKIFFFSALHFITVYRATHSGI